MIGRGPDLAHQVEHIGRQPHVEQIGLVDLAAVPAAALSNTPASVQMLHENGMETEYMEKAWKRPLIVTMEALSLA